MEKILTREATVARIRASAASPDEGMICLVLHYESVDHRDGEVFVNGDVRRVEMLTKAIPGRRTRGNGKTGKAFIIDLLERYLKFLKKEDQ